MEDFLIWLAENDCHFRVINSLAALGWGPPVYRLEWGPRGSEEPTHVYWHPDLDALLTIAKAEAGYEPNIP